MGYRQPSIATRARSRARRAFTLVEMLAVVVIIGVLMGLVTNAAIRARTRAKITAVVMDVSQLDMAVKAYREKFGDYPPDFTDAAAVIRHFQSAFPRYTNAASWKSDLGAAYAANLDPSTALAFWLAGPDLKGFSANPANPFDMSTSRMKPLFEFDSTRAVAVAAGGPYHYYAPYQTVGAGGNPGYIYFRAPYDASTSTCALGGGGSMKPLVKANAAGTAIDDWANASSFQILCAGLDNKYQTAAVAVNYCYPVGTALAAGATAPAGTAYDAAVWDDITNFSAKGTLEDCKPN